MRFRGDDVEPLFLELLPEDDQDASDVSFRPPRRPGTRRRNLVVAGVAAAALVGGAVALGRPKQSPSVAPATTVVLSTTTLPTRVGPVVGSGRDPFDTPPTTAAPEPFHPLSFFAAEPGYGVYLAKYSDGGAVYRFDLTTGAIDPVDVPAASVIGVVSNQGAPAFLNWDLGGFSAPAGDGSVWTYFDDGSLRVLRRANLADPVQMVEELRYEPSGSAGFGGLVGSTAEGRPVVVRADHLPYVVAPDGSLSRLTDGVVLTVQLGKYGVTRCDEAGQCAVTLHSPPLPDVVVGDLADLASLTFSPDGTHAAAFGALDARWQFIDVRSGTVSTNNVDPTGGNGQYGATSAPVGWSPDSRFFFFTTTRGLWIFDATTEAIVPVPGDVYSTYAVLGAA